MGSLTRELGISNVLRLNSVGGSGKGDLTQVEAATPVDSSLGISEQKIRKHVVVLNTLKHFKIKKLGHYHKSIKQNFKDSPMYCFVGEELRRTVIPRDAESPEDDTLCKLAFQLSLDATLIIYH